MNSYLKEIADLCGINKKVTTHTARNTFATTVALENDIPLEVVSKTLGHSSIKMTQRYARTRENLIKKNMQKIADMCIRPSNDIFSGMILAINFAKKNHAAQKIFKPEHA